MTNLTQDLREFTSFVQRQIECGVPGASLEDCLRLWRSQHERSGSIAAIREGLDDVREGRCRPSELVLAEIRSRLSVSESPTTIQSSSGLAYDDSEWTREEMLALANRTLEETDCSEAIVAENPAVSSDNLE